MLLIIDSQRKCRVLQYLQSEFNGTFSLYANRVTASSFHTAKPHLGVATQLPRNYWLLTFHLLYSGSNFSNISACLILAVELLPPKAQIASTFNSPTDSIYISSPDNLVSNIAIATPPLIVMTPLPQKTDWCQTPHFVMYTSQSKEGWFFSGN